MSVLFKSQSASQAQVTPPAATMRVQSSIQGLPIPLVWGVTRLAGNLIWYGDFYSVTVQSGPSSGGGGGGKGGVFSAPQSSGTSSTYNYFVSVELGLCAGQLNGVGPKMWASKSVTTLSAAGLAGASGAQGQAPWSYLTSAHPDQAVGYTIVALLFGNVALGGSTELPNWSVEVTSFYSNAAPGIVDANPTGMLYDILANPFYGIAGWAPAFCGDWTNASNYFLAANLVVSYALTQQTTANQFVSEILESLNARAVWSDKVLKLVPLGDQVISANGAAYFPPTNPIYDLSDADYLTNQNGFGNTSPDPISGQQKPAREQDNTVRVEYLDRVTDYNPATIKASDDGEILVVGERASKGVRQWHWIQNATSAQAAAQLALGRQSILNTYAFTVRPRFILLDPGDLITITDTYLGLFRQWVRIRKITENPDRSLNILADEYLEGSAAAPLYGHQVSAGAAPNYNADPGGINEPIIFEPTDELGGGLQIWLGVSGQTTMFGGYDLYVSTDNATYDFIGRQHGSSRTGSLTSPLPAFPINMTGQTIDPGHTPGVSLLESRGQLGSTTQAGALALNTACYIGGEIVSYETATLTGANAYTLSYLVRNAYGTENLNVNHPTGTRFLPLDGTIMKIPFDQTRIGQMIYFKIVPFNLWGAGGITVADVPFYTYVVTGSALASPLPNVANLRVVFEAGFTRIWWDEISDFRSGIEYIVKKGDSYESAQTYAVQAHPPFIAFGAGTYWITAFCQPEAQLLVYSENPSTITLAGNMLIANLVAIVDYQAIGWPGTFTNVAKEGVDPTAVLRLESVDDFLSNPDVLNTPDILNAGGIALSGEWLSSTIIDASYVADCYCNASWRISGLPVGQDVLSMDDFLNNPDILASASAQYVSGVIQIRFATTATGDAFGPPDIFAEPDAFLAGVEWGDWQNFVPGVYRAQYLQLRAQLSTVDPAIIAYLLSLTLEVSLPVRVDHYLGNSVPIGGLTIVFEPDDAIVPKPFNGGPRVGGINNHPLPSVTMDWQGQVGANFVVSALSLSQMTFHFVDASNTPIALTGVGVFVEGY